MLGGEAEFFEEDGDGGGLEGRGKIGDLFSFKVMFEIVGRVVIGEVEFLLDGAEDGSLEAGEGEVETGDLRVGEVVFVGIAIFGGCGDGGAAGVGEAEDFGDFVETLADGVVAGGADDFEGVVGRHVENLGVAARGYESQYGEGRRRDLR